MSVNPREKKALQEMWEGAEDASGADLPDGTYQFKVLSARFHMSEKGKPQFKTKIKVTGGDEEYVDKEMEINDNLETKENMGWFKRKLRRLNITVTDDFDDIVDGAVAEEMEGKVFEGQVKTKNDFLNVYVNRLIGEETVEKEESAPKASKNGKHHEEEETKESVFSEGDQVTWGDGLEGEIVEVMEDDEKARVKTDDDTIVRVKLSLLSLAEKPKGSKKKEEEEPEGVEMPSADEVPEMKASAVREVLVSLGFEPEDMKDPRGVLHAFATLAEEPTAKIDLSEVKPLAAALEVEVEKGASMKDTLKALAKEVQNRLK